MSASEPHARAAQVFESFAAAVRAGDLAAYHALCVEDALPQDQVFLANSERLRAEGRTLRLLQLRQEGEVLQVSFELVDRNGQPVGQGQLTLTQEREGWRIRAL